MKAGMVTQLRVNTKDCLAVLNVMEVLGLNPYDRSFAQCLSTALSSLLGMVIENGVIEEPDAFQYLNRMAPFLEGGNSKSRAHRANLAYLNQAAGVAPPRLPQAGTPDTGQYVPATTGQQTRGSQQSGTGKQKKKSEMTVAEENAYYVELGKIEALQILHDNEDGRELTPEERHRIIELNEILGL